MAGRAEERRPTVDQALADGSRRAAALALLYVRSEALHIALTERGPELPRHAGQISLPGGRLDPGESIEAAALREAREELAVDPTAVRVLGRLSPLFIPPSDFCLFPILAWSPDRPDFVPQPGEVSALIEVPTSSLVDPTRLQTETWPFPDGPRRITFYAVANHKVWGATALVLSEIAQLLRRAGLV